VEDVRVKWGMDGWFAGGEACVGGCKEERLVCESFLTSMLGQRTWGVWRELTTYVDCLLLNVRKLFLT
jgi:hypothetical protein